MNNGALLFLKVLSLSKNDHCYSDPVFQRMVAFFDLLGFPLPVIAVISVPDGCLDAFLQVTNN